MKKNLFLTLTFVGVAALVVYITISCSKKDDFEPTLSLNTTLLSVAAAANSTDTFSITSNTDWTASSSQSWLIVSPTSGSKNEIITITAQQNTDTIARTATITFSAKGVASQTITITQNAAKYNPYVSKTVLSIAAEANSTDTFAITSDTSWTVSSSDSWLTVSPASGSKNGEVIVTAEQNTDTAARTATITVSPTLAPSQTITVKQSGAKYSMTLSAWSFSIPAAENSSSTFTITSNTSWTITSLDSWLTVSPTSGSNNGTITVTAQGNNVGTSRTARVSVVGAFASTITVRVKQIGIPCEANDEIPCEASVCAIPAMPSYESLASNSYLPDPFKFMNGSRMTTKAEWACRRAEIAVLAQEFEYGYKPCTPYSATTASYSGNAITVTVTSDNGKTISFNCYITYPSTGTAPYPAIIGFGYSSLDNTLLSNLGVAIISFPNDDIAQQSGATSRGIGKFYDFFCENHSASAIMAWAWGVSRLIDALEKTPAANIDPTRLGVTGCSRNGKGALCAGAFDERIVLTIPQESGSGGSASWRVSDAQLSGGIAVQTLSQIVTENCWFRANFSQFSKTATKLPFDHHMIEALCAPRALLVIENTSMTWLGNLSTWTTGNAAHMVWEALGVPDKMGFSQVGHSDHCGFPASQQPELSAYIQKFLVGGGTDNTTIMKTDNSALIFDAAKWIDWTVPSLQ